MTTEVEHKNKKWFGLRSETHRRLFDHRRWTRKVSPMITEGPASGDRVLALRVGDLNAENPAPDEFAFVHARTEDSVVVRKTPHPLEDGTTTILTREQINEANLANRWGEKVIWRETRPGDYPPLQPDQILDPVQQSFELA